MGLRSVKLGTNGTKDEGQWREQGTPFLICQLINLSCLIVLRSIWLSLF